MIKHFLGAQSAVQKETTHTKRKDLQCSVHWQQHLVLWATSAVSFNATILVIFATSPADCLLATASSPSPLPVPTSHRNHKSALSVIALAWLVIWEARTTDPFQEQTGGGRHNDSDSSHRCRSVGVLSWGVSVPITQTQAENGIHFPVWAGGPGHLAGKRSSPCCCYSMLIIIIVSLPN